MNAGYNPRLHWGTSIVLNWTNIVPNCSGLYLVRRDGGRMRHKSVFIFVLVLLNCRLIWAQNYSMPFRFEANQGQADARISYIARGGSYTADLNQNEVVIHVGPESVQMRFAGGKPATAIEPMEELPERTNYYGGSRENWFTDIKNYRRVVYRNVYPDIDVAFRSEGDRKC